MAVLSGIWPRIVYDLPGPVRKLAAEIVMAVQFATAVITMGAGVSVFVDVALAVAVAICVAFAVALGAVRVPGPGVSVAPMTGTDPSKQLASAFT